ncbi:MAG TPA: metal-sulfur cluster assembly factor [Gaiellaceae bacterium]|jgi:metal-sulfur cluster biosynthetic enzyme|nr:metal-sulfur cluster assembly factor [Gaiellaceae bacterium]HYM63994.1 metal-sulfur cluster assembly factor [Gaiellaceae bacterium]
MPTREDVFEALKVVEDPELGMDIVELGLVYDVEVEGPKVHVTYSLTSMGCPVGPLIEQQIAETVSEMPGVEEVEPELTWSPPWSPEKMSDDAKFILGFG